MIALRMIAKKRIAAVTVIYSDRAASPPGGENLVRDVVAVDNESKRDRAVACAEANFSKARVKRQTSDLGSAGGDMAGIMTVASLSNDYIMLYADDVVTLPRSLNRLLQDFTHLTKKAPVRQSGDHDLR